MTYALSRLLSVAAASYGGYALADPGHLGRLLAGPVERQSYDSLALTYGARDLTLGLLGTFGSERTTATAATVTVLCGVADGLILSSRVDDQETRGTILALTAGWAALGSLLLLVDRRRAKRQRGQRLTLV